MAPVKKPGLTLVTVATFSPVFVGLLAFLLQEAWHSWYWGIPIWGRAEYQSRTHTIEFATVAGPLLLLSMGAFLIATICALYFAFRRGFFWVLGAVGAILLGGVLVTVAAVGALMGGA